MPQVQPSAVPAPATPQAGAPKTGTNKFLVPLILGGLFIVAVALILFFALRH
jgi:LPXTG-motif cell wall-anchored protein